MSKTVYREVIPIATPCAKTVCHFVIGAMHTKATVAHTSPQMTAVTTTKNEMSPGALAHC